MSKQNGKQPAEATVAGGSVKVEVPVADLVGAYFQSHPQSEDQQKRSQEVRDASNLLAQTILQSVPKGADQTACIRKIREVSMTAVQAITLEEFGK